MKYNATKALVSLGQWSEHAMTIIVKCMKEGSYDMQSDLVKTLINARNVHLVNKVRQETVSNLSIISVSLNSKLKQYRILRLSYHKLPT